MIVSAYCKMLKTISRLGCKRSGLPMKGGEIKIGVWDKTKRAPILFYNSHTGTTLTNLLITVTIRRT
jgi:hypothetical protein